MNREGMQSKRRIVALEIRPRVMGFIIFDERKRIVDWGTRKYRVRTPALSKIVTRKINAVLDSYFPYAIVVRTRNVKSRKARRRIDIVTRVLRAEAKRRAIKLQIIKTKNVRRTFQPHHCKTKHEIAALIARWFPELSTKLPRKRKSWKTEDFRMILFDAAATGITFLENS
jgi:hypothetical protein